MKKMNPRTDLASNQAKNLLFASLYMNMGDVLQATQTLSNRPELSEQIRETLHKMMVEEMPKLKGEMTHEELKDAAKQRVEEWTNSIGTPSIDQYAALSKYWGVPISDVIKEKITPQVIFDLLNCFVVGQDDYKRQLATSFYIHLMGKDQRIGLIELPNETLFVYGPSGSGKTYTIQTLGSHFGVPVIIVHCNTLVAEGIVGSCISDYFTGAWLALKGKTQEEKIKEISHAVVLFDESDKLPQNHYGSAIYNEMLSIIDDNGEVRFKVNFNSTSPFVTVPNKNMMFVFTGVFDGLDKIRSGDSLGFRNADTKPQRRIESSDLVKYGLRPEIVGRIQNYTTVERLSVDDLYELLNSKMGSPLNDFLNYFHYNDVEFSITPDAMMALAQIAYKKELGVRGLKGLLNNILKEEMFNLSQSRLVIDRNFIEQYIN